MAEASEASKADCATAYALDKLIVFETCAALVIIWVAVYPVEPKGYGINSSRCEAILLYQFTGGGSSQEHKIRAAPYVESPHQMRAPLSVSEETL